MKVGLSESRKEGGCVSIYPYICYKLTDVRQIKIAVIYIQKLEKENDYNIVLSCFLVVYIEQLQN